MKTTKLIIFAAMALALPACSERDDMAGCSDDGVAIEVSADIEGADTRASGTTWESGDIIGISGGEYINKKYTYTSKFSSASGIFEYSGTGPQIFVKSGRSTFTAYYPYNSSVNNTNKTIPKSTSNNGAYNKGEEKEFDFLFATADASVASPNANFTFSHKMTKLILWIGSDAESWFSQTTNITTAQKEEFNEIIKEKIDKATFKVGGLKHSGTFNTSDGTAAVATSTASDVTIKPDGFESKTSIANPLYRKKFSLILFPQSGATITIGVTIDGTEYTCNINPALLAGEKYTYDIKLTRSGLSVSNCSIGAWIQDNSGTGITSSIEYIDPFNGHEAVYMGEMNGKKIYFADRNIGADSPEDPGLYFWWGDVEGAPATDTSHFSTESCSTLGKVLIDLFDDKMITTSTYETAVLTSAYDAAQTKWKGRWRMPTQYEFKWLISENNCTWEKQLKDGEFSGFKVTSNATGNSIFLPVTGVVGQSPTNPTRGYYWTANPDNNGAKGSVEFQFKESIYEIPVGNPKRYTGRAIRPVIVK